MKTAFWKMHGAANDFIMVDDRSLTFPTTDTMWIRTICSRRWGIGSEGLILIQPSDKADFQMRFFNPDGAEAEMCGNGARCVARLANDIGVAPIKMRFETLAGIVHAEILGKEVRIQLPDPKDWNLNGNLNAAGRNFNYGFVNTGVPHFVSVVNDLDTLDITKLGSAIRFHSDFSPRGTNANFITIADDGIIRIRTYERGVEDETLACGTGITAGALIAARFGLVKPPVKLRPASGDILTVDFKLKKDGVNNVTLLGPVVYVFSGTIEHPKKT